MKKLLSWIKKRIFSLFKLFVASQIILLFFKGACPDWIVFFPIYFSLFTMLFVLLSFLVVSGIEGLKYGDDEV